LNVEAKATGVRSRLTGRTCALLLGLCVLLRVVSLVRPCLSDDEAIYGVVGREMLAGRVLYRDVVDHKPPLIYVTYAVTQALGGPIGGMRLLHGLTILVVFATALLLADLTRRLGPARVESARGDDDAPVFAALLYVLFTTTLLDFDALAANCELFMMLPLTGSLALYLRGAAEARASRLAACGALVGVAMLYKYQAAIHLPLYAAHLAWLHRRRPARAVVAAAAIGAGLLGVLGAGAAVLAGTGALSSAWFWFRFNFAYIRNGLEPLEALRRAAVRVSFVVAVASFLWALGVAGAWQGIKRAPAASLPWLAAGWLAVSLLAVAVGGRFFGHYFHQATAPLAVLAAPLAARLWRRRRRLVVAWAGVPVTAFFLLGVFHAPVMAAAGHPDPDYAAIARYVSATSTPTESLVVWGNSPVLYFEANRQLGSRFVFSNYLTGLSPATRTQSDPTADASANVVAESWDMLEADLAARKPALFVDLSPGDIAGYGKFPPARYPRLTAILSRDYQPVGGIAGARVLRRRTQAQ
jgi:4-amino-4-deoxy-L-arabinose transferase-like glycosyltransferase